MTEYLCRCEECTVADLPLDSEEAAKDAVQTHNEKVYGGEQVAEFVEVDR